MILYLLLFLSISTCLTLPVHHSELQHGTEKLIDGVPTQSHYSNNANDKEPTQSFPSITSDASLPFPEVHVTSEVRTVSIQIAEKGLPVITGIVNPIVFAKEPRQDAFFEPTEVEAPLSTPTSTSLVNNTTNSDTLISNVNTNRQSNLHIDNGETFTENKANRYQDTEEVNPNSNTTLNNKSKSFIEMTRKPKRISPFGHNKNQSQSHFSFKDSQNIQNGEVASITFQTGSESKELPETMIHVTKRQNQKSKPKLIPIKVEISQNTEKTSNQTNQMEITTNSSVKLFSDRNTHELRVEDEVVGVAVLQNEEFKLISDSTNGHSEIPVVLASREADMDAFRRTKVAFEQPEETKDQREFQSEKLNKEGISQVSLNVKDFELPKVKQTQAIKSETSKDTTQESLEEKTAEDNVQPAKNQQSFYLDMISPISLDKQIPNAVLKSQEKLLLKASDDNVKTDESIRMENNDQLIDSNVSKRNVTSESAKSEGNSDITPDSSVLEGVIQSRALEPYADIYEPNPSKSPNEEISSSPISEHLDSDLAPGCVTAIVLGVFLCALAAMGSLAFVVYNRHSGIRPKMLSDRSSTNSDSGGYFDDQCRVAYLNSQSDVSKGTPEDLVSLDNDSFLNSLESMTIQNLWTDSIRHTKL